ncbi:MAG: glycosyltransferase family 1 protein, partial [Flammeovirgaceae bacterium]
MQKKKLLIICPYPIGESPSQRFRFEQYFNVLEKKEAVVITKPFYGLNTWQILYTNGHFIHKVIGIVVGFWGRLLLLSTVRKYDFIFIHREATPLGPPWFEWVAAKIFHKRIIYDFDDAIWLPNYSETNARFHRLKAYWKVRY